MALGTNGNGMATNRYTPQRTMRYIETLHAGVVMAVVACATLIYLLRPRGFPSDLLGFVYGGAITYAGGRAGAARAALMRGGDNADISNGTNSA